MIGGATRVLSLMGLLALGIIGILVVPGVAGAQEPAAPSGEPKTIEAERLVIRDKQGRIRVELTVADNEPVVRLLTNEEKPAFELAATNDTFSIKTLSKGKQRLVMSSASQIPDDIQLGLLKLIAVHNTNAYSLTDKIVKTSLQAEYRRTRKDGPPQILLLVDTQTRSDWDVHLGDGRFSVSKDEVRAAYHDAGRVVYAAVERILGYPAWLTEARVAINFFVECEPVGAWTNGSMKLLGEFEPVE